VPANGWNRPTLKCPVKVLHFLFGPKHIGVSLVDHPGRGSGPEMVLKASYPAESGAIHEILNALTLLSIEPLADKVGPLLVQALLLAVERNLHTPQMINPRKGRNTYEKIRRYLQGHFQEAITRESVAAHFHLNPNHLSRLFRCEGPMGFTDYLIWVRIDRAKFLLKHHDIKVDNVARSCGFRDTTYFCRVFRQRTNLTPSRYRARVQQESRPPAEAIEQIRG
jgi:AraC-like DNA-binding protein